MKTVPTSFQTCRNRSCRVIGSENKSHRIEGLPSRASLQPARTANKIAIAGCIKMRKLIGPSQRPMRFSQPRARASSSIDASSWQASVGSDDGEPLRGRRAGLARHPEGPAHPLELSAPTAILTPGKRQHQKGDASLGPNDRRATADRARHAQLQILRTFLLDTAFWAGSIGGVRQCLCLAGAQGCARRAKWPQSIAGSVADLLADRDSRDPQFVLSTRPIQCIALSIRTAMGPSHRRLT
jgi:hypothetical protein